MASLRESPEWIFLRSCLPAFAALRDERPAVASIDWNRLLAVALPHRLTPFVALALQKSATLDEVPANARRVLQASLVETQTIVADRTRLFRRLAERFQSAGIPVCPLKGVAVTLSVYRSASVRLMQDVDILVPEEHRAGAEKVLAQEGWAAIVPLVPPPTLPAGRYALQDAMLNRLHEIERSEEQGRLAWKKPGASSIDLHWSPNYLVDHRWMTLDWQKAWTRTQTVEGVRLLSSLDQLLLGLLHFLDGCAQRYVSLGDLLLLQREAGVSREDIRREWTALPHGKASWPIAAALLDAAERWREDELPHQLGKNLLWPLRRLRAFAGHFRKRDRLLFALGYLVPNRTFYQGTCVQRWAAHYAHAWKKLGRLFGLRRS